MTFNEFFKRACAATRHCIKAEVNAWRFDHGIAVTFEIWDSVTEKRYDGATMDAALALFLEGLKADGEPVPDKPDAEIALESVGAVVELPAAVPADPVPYEERATSTNEPTGY